MKNVVTPETARKLKEAGFKKSRAEKGEIWYAFENRPYFIFEQTDQFVMGIYLDGDFQTAALPAKFIVAKYTFAPTVTDIMRELGHKWFCAYLEANDVFYCTSSDEYYYYSDKNPAEAAALAWLEKYAE